MNGAKVVRWLGVGVCAALLLGCSQGQSPYTTEEVKSCAAEQARYLDELVEACYGKFAFDDCPAVPGIKAEHRKRQEAAGCR